MASRNTEVNELPHPLYAQFFNFRPRKGDIRRARIIESAITCLSTLGVEATSFEAIGKQTGMLRAHVAYYYKDRRDIVRDAIKFCVATVQSITVEHVSAATTDKERLVAFIEATFEWAEKFPKHLNLILLMYYYASYDPTYRKLHTEIRELGAQRIGAIVKPLVSEKRSVDYRIVAKRIQYLITGNLVEYASTTPSVSLAKLKTQTIKEALECL